MYLSFPSNKITFVIGFLIVLTPGLLMAAKNPDHVDLVGVKGKVLTNIQSRLQDLSKSKPLLNEPDEALIQQTALAMQPFGYFKPVIHIIRSDNGKHLKITINPEAPILVTRLSVRVIGEGAANSALQQSIRTLPLKQGKPVNSVKYEKTKQLLIDAAGFQGYLKAHFEKAEIAIDKAAYTSDVRLILNTGPQYYFGQVQFDPTYISPDLLHRYVPFHYGQPYSAKELLRLNNQLSSSGYFSNVAVKPDMKEDSRTIPVKIALKPAHRDNYSLGLGYGTDTGIRGRAGYHVVPVNRAGHKFDAIALGSFNQNSLQAQYHIPGKNPLTDEYNIAANVSNLNYDAGYSNAFLTSLAQRHNQNNFERILSLNGLYERFNYTNTPKEAKLTFFPKLTLSWKKISNPLFSPSGYHVTVNGLIANTAVLSQVSFAQASIDARAALNWDAIHTRFYIHSLQGVTEINNINQLPLSLALLLGGTDNLKAYSFNSLGPGKTLQYNGLEIQKELMKHWYLTSFFDSGTVYNPGLKTFENDVGIGLMWVSPIGPIKIGLAEAVDSGFHRTHNKRPKFVLTMGPDL